MNQGKVTQVRRLLAEAKPFEPEYRRRMRGPLGTIRRRHLIQEAKLLASRYALQEHLDALIYAAGAEAITGLDLEQLEQLVTTLERMGAALDTACDSPLAPPAR
jgi:hypothetical protein